MITQGIVLVADDDRPIVELIAEVLADEGYRVRRATNGAEATAILLTELLDLALLDLLFGGMSGLDVLRAVRAQGISVPIVIMTANTPLAQQVQAQGAASCLLKPFDLDELLACVAHAIRPRSA